MKGRALIICFDGTSNQFGKNNTNVIELYDRIIKSENQLTYYNSGVGTYATPSWRLFTYWKQVIFNIVDMAIAWSFEKIVLGGYRWLSANYKAGDRIYLFGFSRGAYQVRVLAAMIDKVGLILPGNEEQIPFAYELYADHNSDHETFNMAARFKKTFSRGGSVQVHYLGVWDTISSIGMTRSKSLPSTDKCEHFCYMRHALALDEQRVKFLPEYSCGGESWDPNPTRRLVSNALTEPHWDEGLQGKNIARTRDKPELRPRVKEVWFAGSHSDINTELNNAAIPALWMGNEAMMAGLDLRPSRAIWNWETLRNDRPTGSLDFVWWILELFPFKRLSYTSGSSTCWWPHFASPRIIKPGQKIHASVAFIDNYRPKAKFWAPGKGMPASGWDNIVGRGDAENLEWAHALGDLLELDLFDYSDIPNIMNQLNKRQSHTRVEHLDRLAFMANDGTSSPSVEFPHDLISRSGRG
ncbi:hypothetical protein BD779DRAFT_1447593 [Infundibulicybe gibba]|nr:hypothetical protein BD779DRAFT_1447593 [Infundibulicybe gibba]